MKILPPLPEFESNNVVPSARIVCRSCGWSIIRPAINTSEMSVLPMQVIGVAKCPKCHGSEIEEIEFEGSSSIRSKIKWNLFIRTTDRLNLKYRCGIKIDKIIR